MSEEKVNPNSLIEKILGYVDSPFKLFAILLMAVFAFVGYFVWQNQAFLIGAYKEQQNCPASRKTGWRMRRRTCSKTPKLRL